VEIVDVPRREGLHDECGPPVVAELNVKGGIGDEDGGSVGLEKAPVVLIEAQSLVTAASDAFAAVDAKFGDDLHLSVDDAYGLGRTGTDAVHTTPTGDVENLDSMGHDLSLLA
jgi:hypothetical protein